MLNFMFFLSYCSLLNLRTNKKKQEREKYHYLEEMKTTLLSCSSSKRASCMLARAVTTSRARCR
jgi:hypothetical protein